MFIVIFLLGDSKFKNFHKTNMLTKIKNLISDWGHFGFLLFGLMYYLSGATDMVSLMLTLFVIEEVSSSRYDPKP
jgi:hypothetical protein